MDRKKGCGVPDAAITRTIVIPEGSARILADSGEEIGSIFAFGVPAKYKTYVEADQWYSQANKVRHDAIHESIGQWLAGSSRYDSFDAQQLQDGSVTITAFDDRGQYKDTEVITLSPGDFRVLKSVYSIQGPGSEVIEGVEVKNYGEDQLQVPETSRYDYEGTKVDTEVITYRLEEFQFEPASYDEFYYDELVAVFGTSRNPWTGRVLLLAVGAICVALLIYFRKIVIDSVKS